MKCLRMLVTNLWFVMVWVLVSVESSGNNFKSISIDPDSRGNYCRLTIHSKISSLTIREKITNLSSFSVQPKSVQVVGLCSWKMCARYCNCIVVNDTQLYFSSRYPKLRAERILYVARVEKDQRDVALCSKWNQNGPIISSSSIGNYLPQISTLPSVDSSDHAETPISSRRKTLAKESPVSEHQDVNAQQSESDTKDLEDEAVDPPEGTLNPLMDSVASSPLPDPLDTLHLQQVDENLGQSSTIFEVETFEQEAFPVTEQRSLAKPNQEPVSTFKAPSQEPAIQSIDDDPKADEQNLEKDQKVIEIFKAETTTSTSFGSEDYEEEIFPVMGQRALAKSTMASLTTSEVPWIETTHQDIYEGLKVDPQDQYLTDDQDILGTINVETNNVISGQEDYSLDKLPMKNQRTLPKAGLVSTSGEIPEVVATQSTIQEGVQAQKTPQDGTDKKEMPSPIDSETTTAISDLENYKMKSFPAMEPTTLSKPTKNLSSTEMNVTQQRMSTDTKKPKQIDSEPSSTWSLWSEENQLEESESTLPSLQTTQSSIESGMTTVLSSTDRGQSEIEMTRRNDVGVDQNTHYSFEQTTLVFRSNLPDWPDETDLPQASMAHQSLTKTSPQSSDTTTLIPTISDLNEMHANEMASSSYTTTTTTTTTTATTTTLNPSPRHPSRQGDEIWVGNVHANQDRAMMSDSGFIPIPNDTEQTSPVIEKLPINVHQNDSSYFWTICVLILICVCVVSLVSVVFWVLCKTRKRSNYRDPNLCSTPGSQDNEESTPLHNQLPCRGASLRQIEPPQMV